jgi:hypothetical protein
MTVNNTSVDRFVITGSSAVAHSQTGLPGSWVIETGTFAETTEFVNGLWINYGPTLGRAIKTSTDASTWNLINPSFPNPTDNGYAWRFSSMGRIKFFKNKWYAYVLFSEPLANRIQITEFTSSDLTNWTQTGNVSGTRYYSTEYENEVTDVLYDPGTDTTVLATGMRYIGSGSNYIPLGMIYSKVGTGAWNWRMESSSNTVVGAYRSGAISFINGFWCVNLGSQPTTGVYTSIDGVNFTARPLPSGATGVNFNTGSLVYNDGRLLTYIQSSSGGSTGVIASSLNGGRTWTQFSTSTPVYQTQHAVRQWMASYGGVILMVNGSLSTSANNLVISQNGGSSVTSFTISPSLGNNIYGVAARKT